MALELLTEVKKIFWKKGRLETYTHWPFKPEDGTCTPERMAAAGFYVVDDTDEHDTVECFICGKQLDGWDASDDPWEEHANHQQDCPFVLLGKQDEMQWTIDDLFNLVKAYHVNDCTRKINDVVRKMKLESQVAAQQIPKIYKAERKSRKGGK